MMEGGSDAPAGAVFLSYASQHAEAAQRICDALRAAGVEVWLDKSDLRGGDAWDRSIRQQIHDCGLFVPIISQHTHERLEGYFRREWKLAVDRTHDMAEEKAFLVPVVIDDTSERVASVPDKFRDVQWTHVLEGAVPPTFIERVKRLLSGEVPAAPERDNFAGITPTGAAAPRSRAARGPLSQRTRLILATAGAVAMLALG